MPVQLAQFLFEPEPQLSSVPWQKAQASITASGALLNLTAAAWFTCSSCFFIYPLCICFSADDLNPALEIGES